MTPDVPLEIQWFAYALADNGLLTDEDAQAFWESLEKTDDLSVFAQAILDQLLQSVPEEEQEAWGEQIQSLVDFACEQAASGMTPDGIAAGGEAVTDAGAEETLSYEAPEIDLCPGCFQMFLPGKSDIDKCKHKHCRDDGKSSRQLYHRGKITAALTESVTGGNDARRIIDRSSGPKPVCLIRKSQRPPHYGKKHDHCHIKEKSCRHGVCDIFILRVYNRSNSGNRTAAAYSGTGRYQVGKFPIQSQSPADKISAAETGKKSKEHDHQRKFSDRKYHIHTEGRTEKYDSEFQYLFGCELQSGHCPCRTPETVDDHTGKQCDDRCADYMHRQ